MIYASDIYQWFKELSAHKRVDFIYNIMQLCLSSELRFFSILLEDINSKDYANLKEIEERSNSLNEFRQYPHSRLTVEVVHKLCLSLSLLKSTNQKVAQAIYEILHIHFEYASKCMKIKNDFSMEILLMYSMASYHPAFSFYDKQRLSKYLEKLRILYKSSDEKFISHNSNNNNCCKETKIIYDKNKLNKIKILIPKIVMENNDAILTLCVERDIDENATSDNNNEITLKFSEMKTIVSKLKKNRDKTSKLYEMDKLFIKLSTNGNFTVENIRTVVEGSLRTLFLDDSKTYNEILKRFCDLHSENNDDNMQSTIQKSKSMTLSTEENDLLLSPDKQIVNINSNNKNSTLVKSVDDVRKHAVVSVNCMSSPEEFEKSKCPYDRDISETLNNYQNKTPIENVLHPIDYNYNFDDKDSNNILLYFPYSYIHFQPISQIYASNYSYYPTHMKPNQLCNQTNNGNNIVINSATGSTNLNLNLNSNNNSNTNNAYHSYNNKNTIDMSGNYSVNKMTPKNMYSHNSNIVPYTQLMLNQYPNPILNQQLNSCTSTNNSNPVPQIVDQIYYPDFNIQYNQNPNNNVNSSSSNVSTINLNSSSQNNPQQSDYNNTYTRTPNPSQNQCVYSYYTQSAPLLCNNNSNQQQTQLVNSSNLSNTNNSTSTSPILTSNTNSITHNIQPPPPRMQTANRFVHSNNPELTS